MMRLRLKAPGADFLTGRMPLPKVFNFIGMRPRDLPVLILFAAAFVGSIVARCILMPNAPLWLDECWTGAIAGQPTWAATIDQIWLDANAPLYPLFMHGWITVFGDSNAALRLPSLLFSVATPVLIFGWRIPGLLTQDRLALATLIAVCQPALLQSNEARGYTLLMFLATGQTFAFIRLLQRSDLQRAAYWAIWASLVGMTHYLALALCAVQGLIFLVRARSAAFRTWPAAFAFAPLGLVLLWHLPRLAQFARPDVAWYSYVTVDSAIYVAQFVLGNGLNLLIPIAGLVYALLIKILRPDPPVGYQMSSTVLWAAVSALLATVLLLLLGAVRPSFTIRYVTPFIPGLWLLMIAGARSLSSVMSSAVVALMLMASALSAVWTANAAGHLRHPFTFEAASRDLLAVHPSRLVFTWDHPAQKVEAVRQYDALGGFLFRRLEAPIEITSILVRQDEDPNRLLLQAANEPHTVILWLYDLGVQGTAAIRYPPRLSELDPDLGCRNYGRGSVGVLACAREWRSASKK